MSTTTVLRNLTLADGSQNRQPDLDLEKSPPSPTQPTLYPQRSSRREGAATGRPTATKAPPNDPERRDEPISTSCLHVGPLVGELHQVGWARWGHVTPLRLTNPVATNLSHDAAPPKRQLPGRTIYQ